MPYSVSTSNYLPWFECFRDKATGTKQALQGVLKGILDYTGDEVLSCDFNSDTNSFAFIAAGGIDVVMATNMGTASRWWAS